MTSDRHQDLLRYLKDQAGEYLRGVAVYTTDDYKIVYLRDDIRSPRFESEADAIITRIRQESRVREHRSFPFDDLRGTVRAFGDAMVMHFPRTQERGTVITLDPGVARDLNTFMGGCLKRIEA